MFIRVFADANIVMGAESVDFFFDCWYLKILRMTEFYMFQGAYIVSLKTLDWKRSKISMFELYVAPQSWMPYVQMGLSIIL
jgi:hypothetical protein